MAKKVATWIIVPFMFLIFILDMMTLVLCNIYEAKYEITNETFTLENGDDRIHFLHTGCSDCILLESNGRFALVDAGEGNYNPRKNVEYDGYEEQVISYIKKVCADEDGIARLDFMLLTHQHYDHSGNAEAIFADEEIEIGTLFMKELALSVLHDYEIEVWDVPGIYERIIAQAETAGTAWVCELPENMTFGDFEITLYNTKTPLDLMEDQGNNAESVGMKLEKADYTVFLAADIATTTGQEDLHLDEIGEVDLLKIGHHGYFGSSSMRFLKALSPEIAIVTNTLGKIYPNVKWNLTVTAKVPIYATVNRNGIIATITDDGNIVLTENIH
ncbi:MAG: MBL fold metallo-hydrolase [Clostridia bacterium]|nr:MBL fold metallo-hydrolase [Clostridia bacterium]